MVNRLQELEAEIRSRFAAVAGGAVIYREDPTVGSDRDMMSFLLEWSDPTGEFNSVSVHLDHIRGDVITRPAVNGLGDASYAWLDNLLANVPACQRQLPLVS